MMRPGGLSLRARLIALLLATLIPLVGLAGYWILREARRDREYAERQGREVATRVAAQVTDILGDVQGMLSALAHVSAVQAQDRAETERLFRETLATWPMLENLAAFTKEGTLFAATTSGASGTKILVQDRDWFQAVVLTGRPVAGGFLVSRLSGKPVAVLAQPVMDRQGRVLGVVGAALELAAVSREVVPVQLGTASVWAVVDGEGLVLLHGDPRGSIGKPLGPLPGMLRAEAVVRGTQWRAVVGIPHAVINASVRNTLVSIGLPALLIFLGATVAGFWIARGTWRPLQELATAVRRIGAGEPEVQLPVEGGGEVREVAAALQDAMEAVAAREGDLARRNTELRALVEATRAIASSLDLEKILQAIVHQAATISGTPFVRLFLVDEKAQVLRYRVGVGLPPEAEQGLAVPVGESFSGQVAATGQPSAVADCRDDPRLCYPEHAMKYGLISYLGLPVKLGDRVLGVLVFNTTAPRAYLQEEIVYLSAFADQAAIAIENARLHETTFRRAQLFATLNDLSRVLAMALDPQAVAREILAAVRVLMPEAAGRLWQQVGKEAMLSLVASIGLREPEGGATRLFPLGEGLAGIAAATRQPVTSQDVVRDPRFVNKAWAAAEGLVSCVIIPLIYADRVTGVLAIFTRAPHTFTEDEVSLLSSFAAQAAIAIENARLFAATEGRATELATLREIGQAITSRLEVSAVLEAVAAGAMQLLGSQHAQIIVWDEQGQRLRYGAALGPEAERVRTQVFELGKGINGVVALNRQPMILDDYQASSYALPEFPDVVAAITVPILFGDRLLGVLHSHTTQAGRRFTPDDLRLFQMLATQAAIAIENARLYDTIRHHAAEMEARVRQRTAELEEALRVRVEFLGRMSHELRTPLNFIIGFSELLKQGIGGPLTPKQATYIDRIYGGGKRLLSLFNDILDIAQADAGKSRLHLEPVIVGPLVQEVLGLVQVQAGQKRLKVTTALDPWLPFIVADRFKLAQILHNLVGNAVKFTPEGGSIRLTTRRVDWSSGQRVDSSGPIDDSTARPIDAPAEWLELAVEDTGIGIRPENLESIFAAFYQVDGSDTRAHGGAGLGLTLVRKLVELHGDRVWAESAGPEQGARFVVRLPRLEVPKPKKILLVEDEGLIRIQMTSALESAGFAVVQAATGTEALANMEAVAPDLMILDIMLPDMEGWEILRRVRDVEEISTLPVLVVSGLESVNMERALARGADDFLTKPVSPRVLVDTVVRLLGQSAAASGLAGQAGTMRGG